MSLCDHWRERFGTDGPGTRECPYCTIEELRGRVTDLELANGMKAGEIERLRGLLADVMPLLAECDCIHSDREAPLCPCRAARKALGPAHETSGERMTAAEFLALVNSGDPQGKLVPIETPVCGLRFKLLDGTPWSCALPKGHTGSHFPAVPP